MALARRLVHFQRCHQRMSNAMDGGERFRKWICSKIAGKYHFDEVVTNHKEMDVFNVTILYL